jgi:hypothetical protein
MNQTLIDAIVKITGKPEEEVQTKLADVQLDDIYKLMDLVRTGDKASIIDFIDPIKESMYFRRTNEDLEYTAKFKNQNAKDELIDWLEDQNINYTNRINNVTVVDCPDRDTAYRLSRKVNQIRASIDTNLQTFKDMATKPPKPGTQLPKPRDPMAKALALPQYQPKVTPSKRGIEDKADRKHKGKKDYMEAFDLDRDLVEEGVMGMTTMNSMLPRLLTLAGRPPMEDEAELPIIQSDDEIGILPASEIEFNQPAFDEILDFEPTVMDATPVGSGSATQITNIQSVRDAFENVRANLPEIKVSEFAEVRSMMADLMSQIDRMGNTISGK